MGEIQNLIKQVDFNKLVYYFKGEDRPNNFISFKDQLKENENEKKNKSDINEKVKRRYKSEDQKSTIKNFQTFLKSREKVIKLFNDYSKIISKAKYS